MNVVLFSVVIALATSTFAHATVIESDLCIYGGTAAGVSAACSATRLGKKAVLLEFGTHIGGLTSGGLGWTDIGNKAAIGGFARDFYKRLGAHYGKAEAWYFEPHVAEAELRALLKEASIPTYFQQRLATVKKEGSRIVEIAMENGDIYRASIFLDCTYEGDLMAKAGVDYMIGREANSRFDETLNGVRAKTPSHQFGVAVDPYVVPGDPASGLLPFVQAGDGGLPGAGDACVQAYNFRLCLTNNPANRNPIEPPPQYDPARYELLGRYMEALVKAGQKPKLANFLKIDMVTPEKTDINNQGGFSTDYIGFNYHYPEADYATRATIWAAHEHYIRGLLTFLANDPRVPGNVRAEMKEWGFPKDEFVDTNGWPHQLYVREARRMTGAYVMTEKDCRGMQIASDPVGLGAYNMDSHNCQRLVKNGRVENEGDVQVGVTPYPISYRSLIPVAAQCTNLLVPVCLSATHIAYGSIRMEPVFMILGQSAAAAASLAIDHAVPLQQVDYAQLRAQLEKDAQILSWNAPAKVAAAPKLEGIVLDDRQAERNGEWLESSNPHWARVGGNYLHDNNANKGALSIRWTPEIPVAAQYEVIVHFPPNPNRATNVPVKVISNNREVASLKVDQKEAGGSRSLGVFSFPEGKAISVTLSNEGTNGHVIADGIQLLRR